MKTLIRIIAASSSVFPGEHGIFAPGHHKGVRLSSPGKALGGDFYRAAKSLRYGWMKTNQGGNIEQVDRAVCSR